MEATVCALLKGTLSVTIHLTFRLRLQVKLIISANWVGVILINKE